MPPQVPPLVQPFELLNQLLPRESLVSPSLVQLALSPTSSVYSTTEASLHGTVAMLCQNCTVTKLPVFGVGSKKYGEVMELVTPGE